MDHILTLEPENGEYEPIRSFKTFSKNHAYQRKSQREG